MKKFLTKAISAVAMLGLVASLSLTASASSMQYLLKTDSTVFGGYHQTEIKVVTEGSDTVTRTVYTYDENDCLTSAITYRQTGTAEPTISQKIEYVNDNAGNCVKESKYRLSGEELKLVEVAEREYDAANRCIEKRIYKNGAANPSQIYTGTYNADGTYVETMSYYDVSGATPLVPTDTYIYTYTYDESGNVTTKEDYKVDSPSTNHYLYHFTYDTAGNLVQEIKTIESKVTPGVFENQDKTEYQYDEKGRKISYLAYLWFESEWCVSGNTKKTWEYEDRADGYTVTELDHSTLDDAGEIFSKYSYTFDKYGNQLEQIAYKEVGTAGNWLPTTTITYTYEPDRVEIITGAGQAVDVSTATGASFTSSADFAAFQKVTVDGKDVADKYYTVASGSTVVTLSEEFLTTLSNGEHTLAIVSETGTAETTFTVSGSSVPDPAPAPDTKDDSKPAPAPDAKDDSESASEPASEPTAEAASPKTGDTGVMLYLALACSAMLGGAVVFGKRKEC